MAFKMKGSPAKRGIIQGTSGHASALKVKKAKKLWDYVVKPIIKKIDDFISTPTYKAPPLDPTKTQKVVEFVSSPKNAAIIGGTIDATTNIVSDIAQKNVEEDLAESQIETNKALEEGAQTAKWNKSTKLFDKALKAGKVTTDLILPDAKGVTNYDKLATSRNIRFSNLQNQVGDTDTDVYDFLPYDYKGNTDNPGKYFGVEGTEDLKENQHLLTKFQGGKVSIFPDSTTTNP